ncbi:MAG: hypothetical protein WBA87_13080 [Microbacterium sp.]
MCGRELGNGAEATSTRRSNTTKSSSKATSTPASKLAKTGATRRAHDAVTQEMIELLRDSGFFAQASEEVITELLTLTRDLEPLVEPDTNARLVGADASAFTERLVQAWTAHAIRQLAWPSAKLLYAVRRLPLESMVALALLRMRMSYDTPRAAIGVERLLAVCAGITRRSEPPVRTGLSSYLFTTDELKDLTHHVLRITHLWLLHGTARIVGKGGDIEVDSDGFPVSVVDAETTHAMAHYDERLKGMTLDGVIGTDIWDTTIEPGPLSLLTVSPLGNGPIWTRVDGIDRARITASQTHISHPPESGDVLQVLERFEIEHLDLTRFREVITGTKDVSQGLSPELPSLIVLLHGLARSSLPPHIWQHLDREQSLSVQQTRAFTLIQEGAEVASLIGEHLRREIDRHSNSPAKQE